MTVAGTVAGDDLRRAVYPDNSTGLSAQIVGPIACPAGEIEHTQPVKVWDLPGCPHISRQIHDVLCVSRIGITAFHEIVLLPSPAVRMDRQASARATAVRSTTGGLSSDNSVPAGAGAPPGHTTSTASIAIRYRPQSILSSAGA